MPSAFQTAKAVFCIVLALILGSMVCFADEIVEDASEEFIVEAEEDSQEELDFPENSVADEVSTPAVESMRVMLSKRVLFPGELADAWVEVYPEQTVHPVWSSSDPSVVIVNDNATVEVRSDASVPDEGTDVDIWARISEGTVLMNCVTVHVMPRIRSLSMAEDYLELSLEDNAVAGVVAVVEPVQLVGMAKLTWESADPGIADVRISGSNEVAMITAVAPGTTTVTVYAQDGSKHSQSMTVEVK